MKKKRPFFPAIAMIIILTMLSNSMSYAQITITNADMPSVNNSVLLSNSFTIPGNNYAETGENFNWDFTDLIPLTQRVDTFVSVTSVPFLYQLIFIPNLIANLAQPFTEIDLIPGAPLTDAYRFFRKSTASYNDVGFAFTITDIPVPLRFNSPDIIYKFPLAFGNADSSFSGVQFGIPDLGYISIDRKRVNKADGWGTLTTSYGTFDVLRLKSRVIETDSIYIDSLGFGTALERDYIEYKWLANGFRAPLLQITEEGPLVTVAWIDSIFDPSVNIREILPYMDLMVSPNPFTESTQIRIQPQNDGRVIITLFDITGKKVRDIFTGTLSAGSHSFTIQSSEANYKNGVYLLKVETENHVETRKLIIQ